MQDAKDFNIDYEQRLNQNKQEKIIHNFKKEFKEKLEEENSNNAPKKDTLKK